MDILIFHIYRDAIEIDELYHSLLKFDRLQLILYCSPNIIVCNVMYMYISNYIYIIYYCEFCDDIRDDNSDCLIIQCYVENILDLIWFKLKVKIDIFLSKYIEMFLMNSSIFYSKFDQLQINTTMFIQYNYISNYRC